MNSARPISTPTTWIGASHADSLPVGTFFLDGRRIGESRLALSTFDVNEHRTCFFGQVTTRFGTISIMVETANPGEEARRIAHESSVATMALDATEFVFDHGRVIASLDPVFGHWCVEVDGEPIADGMSQADAISVAHKQVAR